jgi:hypothetical protein
LAESVQKAASVASAGHPKNNTIHCCHHNCLLAICGETAANSSTDRCLTCHFADSDAPLPFFQDIERQSRLVGLAVLAIHVTGSLSSRSCGIVCLKICYILPAIHLKRIALLLV